jgi:dihydrofolate reductase
MVVLGDNFDRVLCRRGFPFGARFMASLNHPCSPEGPSDHHPADIKVKASVFVGISLDGFIARADGAFDFLPPGGGEPHGYDEFMTTVDALVIGRKTYETILALGAWPYGAKPTFVLSTHSLAPPPAAASVERMSGSPGEIVSRLANRGIRHAYVDGGITIQSFLQAGLIQRLIITRVPVLIGTGIALFGALPRDIGLRHIATHQYASGLVKSEYEVVA